MNLFTLDYSVKSVKLKQIRKKTPYEAKLTRNGIINGQESYIFTGTCWKKKEHERTVKNFNHVVRKTTEDDARDMCNAT